MLKYIVFITQKQLPLLDELKSQCTKKGVIICEIFPENETLIEETIYVTDNEEICKGLLNENACVMAWMHEENKEQNFSAVSYAIENLEEIDFTYFEKIYLRYLGLPWKIAETKRCIIREMTEADLDDVYNVYNGKSITKYMEGLYEDRQEELEYTRSYIQNAYTFWGFGTWIIEKKEAHSIIGRIGLNMREGFEDIELGFVIMEEEQRKGYALECCRAVLILAKEEFEFERVQALIHEGNIASVGLCKKLGFIFEGKVKDEGKEYLKFIKTLHS
ncbi:MAG: GNAT family N-acetyltransferase [Lachnospiraceae bacterium]|nr:GNAT family N-acetyltransferase [Lachnospiraceae bacterium]